MSVWFGWPGDYQNNEKKFGDDVIGRGDDVIGRVPENKKVHISYFEVFGHTQPGFEKEPDIKFRTNTGILEITGSGVISCANSILNTENPNGITTTQQSDIILKTIKEDKVYSLEDLENLKEELQALQYDLERAKTEEAQEELVDAFTIRELERIQGIQKQTKVDEQIDFFIEQWDLAIKCQKLSYPEDFITDYDDGGC